MAAYRYILTHLISCIAAVGVHLPGRPAAIDLHGAQPDDSRARHSTISVHFAAAVCTLLFPTYLVASNIAAFERPGVQQFVREMATKHGFDKRGLTSVLRRAVIRQDIVEAISRPAEKKPWYQYRPIFVNRARIEGGIRFWNQHAETLEQAHDRFGVPPAIIAAVIGVETRYGYHKGSYRVIDALCTLAFAYPPRSRFFRSELEQFLLMTREEGMDPLALKGSYAGAMGQPQFISSSFRRYAVDFDGDGVRDIWNNSADAIGSVANYLSRHGWRAGEAVAAPLRLDASEAKQWLDRGLKPHIRSAQLRRKGVDVPADIPGAALVTFIALQSRNAREYWIGLNNFYVITRYNHSAHYAMAVYQLAEAIRTEREEMMQTGIPLNER